MRSLLITGCSSIHVGKKLQVDYAVPNQVIVDTMTEAGWRVDRRPVIPGEDLSGYDRVLVYLMSPSSFSASTILGALYTLGARQDAVIGVDDWQTKGTMDSYRKGMPNLWKPLFAGRIGWEESLEPCAKALIEKACKELSAEKLSRRLTWWSYMCGDYKKLPMWKADDIFVADPTMFFHQRYKDSMLPDLINPEEVVKEKKWVMASLVQKMDWLEKQKLEWEVETYGNKKLKQPRIPELELLRVYQHRWGILSPSHKLDGTGWWRIRYLMSALAGSVMYGDPKEVRVFGDSFTRYTARQIENMSEADLSSLGAEQADQFLTRLWPLKYLKQQVITFFEQE